MASNGDQEDSWSPARLIPVTGIKGTPEQEARATQALLSVMRGVPEFGSALLRLCGGPRGVRRVDTYTEIRMQSSEGAALRPDGAAVVRAQKIGRMVWLFEVKTGTNNLRVEQVEHYLDLARDSGFDGVITISNQITSAPDVSPVELPKRKGKAAQKPPLWHLSWWRVLVEAVVQLQHRGIEDSDQSWILSQLIEYLDDPRSGVLPLADMGPNWTAVRDGARQGSLNASDAAVVDVAGRWLQTVDYICLSLYRELGVTVELAGKASDQERLDAAVGELASGGSLTSGIRIKDAVSPIQITVDLRSRTISYEVQLDAPDEPQRSTARVNWLARQLKKVPDSTAKMVVIEADYGRGRKTTANLEALRSDPALICLEGDPQRSLRRFRVSQVCEMATKGRKDNGFIDTTRGQITVFYRDIVQAIVPWRPKAPKLRESGEQELTGGEGIVESRDPFPSPSSVEGDPG